MNRSPATLASLLARAHSAGTLLASGSLPELRDAGVAWHVQRAGVAQRVEAGAILVGWKVGYASEAMRREMGIAQANYGPLYADMLLDTGAPVGRAVTQPRAEPEIALLLGQDVDPRRLTRLTPAAARDVLGEAVDEVRCALEVVDSVWSTYTFTWAENTADGSSAAHAVLGEPIPAGLDLATVVVTACEVDAHGNRATYTGTGGAAMGHPLDSLRWLAGALAEQGRVLRAGDLVLTGGLTPTLPLTSGARVSARFAAPGWDGHVEVVA